MTRPPIGEAGVATSWGSLTYPIDPTEPAAELQWPMSVWTYGRMGRTDPQVTAVLRSLSLPLRRDIWRLDPAGTSDEVAAYVSEELDLPILGTDRQRANRNGRVSWDEHVRVALTELVYGFAAIEPVYAVVDARVRLAKLAFRPPETMSQVHVDEMGDFAGITQHSSSGPRQVPADRLLWYSLDHLGAAVTGVSILRAAWADWKLKGRALRVWAMTCERNGMGVPVTEAPDGASQAVMDSLDKLGAAARAGEFSHATLPAGSKLTFQGVTGSLPDVGAFVRYCDEQIARSVLAQFLQLGSQPNGSWALASAQIDFFALALDSVANQIADVTTTQLVDRLVRYQFGEGVAGPVVAHAEPDVNGQLAGEELGRMVHYGALTMDAPLQQWVRHRYRMPEPDPATTMVQPLAPKIPIGGPGDLGVPVAAAAGQSRVAHAMRRAAPVRSTVLGAVAGLPRSAKATAARHALASMAVDHVPVTAEVSRLRADGYRSGAARVARIAAAAPAKSDAEVAADPKRRLGALVGAAGLVAAGVIDTARSRAADAVEAAAEDAADDETITDDEVDTLMADEASSSWAPLATAAAIAVTEYAMSARVGAVDEGAAAGAEQFDWSTHSGSPCDECAGLEDGSPYGADDVPDPDVHPSCECSVSPHGG